MTSTRQRVSVSKIHEDELITDLSPSMVVTAVLQETEQVLALCGTKRDGQT